MTATVDITGTTGITGRAANTPGAMPCTAMAITGTVPTAAMAAAGAAPTGATAWAAASVSSAAWNCRWCCCT